MMSRCEVVFFIRGQILESELCPRHPSFINIQKLVANASDYSQMHILRIHWITYASFVPEKLPHKRMVKSSK